MKQAKKIVALLLCAVLLIGASVAGTMAYLTFTTDEVKNTFTVGKVELGEDGKGGLDEAKVNEYGEKLKADDTVAGENDTLAARVIANTYKLIPGHTYVKDPTLHIKGGSEQCYVFVKVENGIKDIEADDPTEEGAAATTIAGQMEEEGWIALDKENDGVFYMADAKDARATPENDYLDVEVFESFTLKQDADVSNYANAQITVMGYAIQADGFVDKNGNGTAADEAWAAAPSSWNATAPSEG